MIQPPRLCLAVLLCLLPGLRLVASPERVLVLDADHSAIEVQVHATFDSFTGRLTKFHSDIAVDPEHARTTRAQVSFDFADLQTGRERRNRDMLAWTENDRYPTVEFRMESLEPQPGGPAQVRGSLRIHGVEHATTFTVAFLAEDQLYAIDGEVEIDYRDYGLPVIRKFYFLTVDPSLRIRFHLQGRLASPAAAGLREAMP